MAAEEEKKSESIPPEAKGFVARMKSMAVLLTAVTALVAALGTMFKPPDLTATKSGYEELRQSVKELNKATDQNHDDLVTLRAYLEGYANANRANGLGVPSAVAANAATAAASASSPPTSAGLRLAGSSGGAGGVGLSRPPTPPIPDLHPKPATKDPADFSQLKK